jgi:hypothetical protein
LLPTNDWRKLKKTEGKNQAEKWPSLNPNRCGFLSILVWDFPHKKGENLVFKPANRLLGRG